MTVEHATDPDRVAACSAELERKYAGDPAMPPCCARRSSTPRSSSIPHDFPQGGGAHRSCSTLSDAMDDRRHDPAAEPPALATRRATPMRSSRTSAPAARSRPMTGCRTSTAPRSSSSSRCTRTRSSWACCPSATGSCARRPCVGSSRSRARSRTRSGTRSCSTASPRTSASRGRDAPGPARRQDEVPQRLPLPDALLGRRRDHRVARGRRRDRLASRRCATPRTRRTPAR